MLSQNNNLKKPHIKPNKAMIDADTQYWAS